MPLKRRGSVSARLSVWFSLTSRVANASRSASSTSSPPRSNGCRPASPSTRWIDARRVVPASVRTSVPVGKSKEASAILPGALPPAASHRSRPAIIRWMTTNRSRSSASTIRFPMRRRPSTRLPAISAGDGLTDRSTNGFRIVRRSSGWPRILGARQSR